MQLSPLSIVSGYCSGMIEFEFLVNISEEVLEIIHVLLNEIPP